MEERKNAVDKSAAAAKAALARAAAAPRAESVEGRSQAAGAALAAPAGERGDAGEPGAGAASAQAVLDGTHVRQRYPRPKGGHQLVLNDISFRVPEPDFVSVVGPSGCGKSTLLRLILGSESPYQGTVRVRGKIVGHPDRNRGIVFQRYSLFPHLTVVQNVMFGLELDGTWLLQKWLTWPWYRPTHRRYLETAMQYLATVKLDEHASKYPHQLSGGMQQRVAIAQAMIMKPEILLMDEPFGALDPGTRENLQVTIVETFRQQHTTIFFVTHDLEEAIFVGNRLFVLSPFYQADADDEADDGGSHGSKLVMDVLTPRCETTGDKQRGEFAEFIGHVRQQGFDPSHRQRVAEFDLSAAPSAP